MFLVFVASLAGGGWYAHDQGWLNVGYAWLNQLASQGAPPKPEHAGHGMNMPKVDAGSAAGTADMTTNVPGHASVMISGELQQRIGVKIGRVEKGSLEMSVRALGIVQPNETQQARVNLKTEGWVDKLFVNFTGQTVRKGDRLLSIYSPQFVSTQQEYLSARQTEKNSPGLGGLAEFARRRLELWDVPQEVLAELDRTGKPQMDLILQSPITGTVLEKTVLEGERITPEKQLYLIADLSTVWVQAKVYEYEIPHIELGQPATVTVSSIPNRQFTGKVVFIQPTVEEVTRTIQVRVELPNQQGLFKPGMFAQIEIGHHMGEGLLVPTSAIFRTGQRDIAFMVHGEGMFMPVEVKLDTVQFGDRYHILEGLNADDRIVTSANFLIDSESRIRLGGGAMAGMDHGGHGGKEKPAQGPAGPSADKPPAADHAGDSGKKTPGVDHSKMQH
jgi:Cu(I)/Ag(I) efflux system membrane fusion protein